MKRRVDPRRKKKRRLPSSEGESAGIPAGEQRNWADLPALLLGFIVDRLFLLPDLFAFAGVCNSWRSVFLHSAGKDALTYRPPLLLRPIGTFRGQTQKWKKPAARCQLTNPTSNHPPPAPYLCMISSRTLSSSFCIAASFGNLILVNRRRIIIADVFTGHEIVSPELPPNVETSHYTSGFFLTAPPSSPDCRLILSDLSVYPPLLTWLVGSDVWSRHPRLPLIEQLLLFKQHVFAVDFNGNIHSLHFSPQLSSEPLEGVRLPPLSSLSFMVAQLVQCGDELLSVSLNYYTKSKSELQFTVFRLDFSEKVWVEVKDLGDWSLFFNATWRNPLACISSTGWGGRSNCIYFAGSETDSWSVHPLGEVFPYDSLSPRSPLFLANRANPFWPIWVYPSMFSK